MLLESLNMAARQRYKERHQVHRRRQQLINSSSKSYSEDKSVSSSEAGPIPGSIQLVSGNNNLRVCLASGDGITLHHDNHHQSSSPTVKKPNYLELKQTNSPAKISTQTNSGSLMSTFLRADPSNIYCYYPAGEQHPRANTRIYHQPHMTAKKPKLRRDYSVSYEPSPELPHQLPPLPPPPSSSSNLSEYVNEKNYNESQQQPDLVPPHLGSSMGKRHYRSDYINIV